MLRYLFLIAGVLFVLTHRAGAHAEFGLVSAGTFESKFKRNAVRITGVRPNPFSPNKLKVWHWQWNNPVLTPNEGPLMNIYGPCLSKSPLDSYLYYFGWQMHHGKNDNHDRLFIAHKWGDAWKKIETPVLEPDGQNAMYEHRFGVPEWHTGDPSVIEANGRYFMFYTSEGFEKELDVNGVTAEYIRAGIGVAISDDRLVWHKLGPIKINIPKHKNRDLGVTQHLDPNHVRLHLGIARPSVIWTGSNYRLYFDYPAVNRLNDEVPAMDWPGVAIVRDRFVACAETDDLRMTDWKFKCDLHHAKDRSDVDPDVAVINGWYFKATACYSLGLFGACSRDGLDFSWVDEYPAAYGKYQGSMLPPHSAEIFADHQDHSYDDLVASPCLIHDGTTFFGMLYGTSSKPMIHGRICEVYLQLRIQFITDQGTVIESCLADGYDSVFLLLPDRLEKTGTLKIYDTDAGTLLNTIHNITIKPGQQFLINR